MTRWTLLGVPVDQLDLSNPTVIAALESALSAAENDRKSLSRCVDVRCGCACHGDWAVKANEGKEGNP